MTLLDDISVALQFCSKRAVPNLKLTVTDFANRASSPVPPKHPPGRGAARAGERWSEQYAKRDSQRFPPSVGSATRNLAPSEPQLEQIVSNWNGWQGILERDWSGHG